MFTEAKHANLTRKGMKWLVVVVVVGGGWQFTDRGHHLAPGHNPAPCERVTLLVFSLTHINSPAVQQIKEINAHAGYNIRQRSPLARYKESQNKAVLKKNGFCCFRETK